MRKKNLTIPSEIGGGLYFNNVIFEVHLSDLPIYHCYSKRREMWSGTFRLFIETTTPTSHQNTNIYCIYEVYSVYMYK